MSRGFFYKWSDKQTISNADQVVGRLTIPPGNYIILGEACVSVAMFNGTIDLNQTVQCKLKAGTVEDKVKLNLRGDGLNGGKWGVIALNIGVKFDGGAVELTCTSQNPGCILVFDVALSAIEVDQPGMSDEEPSAHQKPNWYIKNSAAWHCAFTPLTQMPLVR